MVTQTQPSQTPRNSLSQVRATKLQEMERKNVELIEKNNYYDSLYSQLRRDIDILKNNNIRPDDLNAQDICELQA